MKLAVAFTILLMLALGASARTYTLYAMLTEDTKVELSDGAVWMMDKGDVFPVESFKNQQQNVLLRLAGAVFLTETARTRILKPEEVEAGMEIYRKNVRAYLESTSKKIQQHLEGRQNAKEKKTSAQP
jgi:hypothetical protein